MIKFAVIRNNRIFNQSEFPDIVNTLRATDGALENCTVIIQNSTTCEFRLEYKSRQKYFVTCNLVTHKTVQLVITIEPQKESETYDFQLEQIKIRLKDLLIIKHGIVAYGSLIARFWSCRRPFIRTFIELRIS